MEFTHTFSEQQLAWIQALSGLAAFAALLLSCLAVYFTARVYWQKRGSLVRGNYVVTSSSKATEDPYVNQVTLENLKDRSITIFGIYVKLARGYMLELERFDAEPLIIRPFELVRRTYGPLDSYVASMKRIKLDTFFEKPYKGKELFISTPDGKQSVESSVQVWNPIHEWFRNHMLITAQIERTTFYGKAYGVNALYVARVFLNGDVVQSLAVYEGDHRLKWLHDLGAKEDTLNSKERVQRIFDDAIKSKKITADQVEIIDVQEHFRRRYEDRDVEPVIAQRHSWFRVCVLGPIMTYLSNWLLSRENKRRRSK